MRLIQNAFLADNSTNDLILHKCWIHVCMWRNTV